MITYLVISTPKFIQCTYPFFLSHYCVLNITMLYYAKIRVKLFNIKSKEEYSHNKGNILMSIIYIIRILMFPF